MDEDRASDAMPTAPPLLGIEPDDEDKLPVVEPMTGIEPDDLAAQERKGTWPAVPAEGPAPRD